MSAIGAYAEFFRAGGTLHLDSPSYVKRPADDELFEQVMSGQFCYVLTPRQMGKSSLMVRTAERLRQDGTRVAIIDLSALGTRVTREQWYLGILTRMADDLGLSADPETWWHQKGSLGPVQRFTDFIHDVVLDEIAGKTVIFVDEIDSTLKLDFTDDFFAAIRALYNMRADRAEYRRLTFVLLGVAAPSDLIKDRDRTPFNIGWAIDLHEFSRQDVQPLQDGLEQAFPGQGQRILDRVFYWTNGHPYLTQKICQTVVQSRDKGSLEKTIDVLVAELFFGADVQDEDNLQFVRNSFEASPYRTQLVQLYRRVYRGTEVREDRRSLLQNRLSLIGLVRTQSDTLEVRNQIYRRVFGPAWIKENTSVNRAQLVTVGAAIVSILAIAIAVLLTVVVIPTRTYSDSFQQASSAHAQIHFLAELCNIRRCQVAQRLFFEMPPDQQRAMFKQANVKSKNQELVTIVDCLYPALPTYAQAEHKEVLEREICCALYRWRPAEGEQFRTSHGLACDCEREPVSDHE